MTLLEVLHFQYATSGRRYFVRPGRLSENTWCPIFDEHALNERVWQTSAYNNDVRLTTVFTVALTAYELHCLVCPIIRALVDALCWDGKSEISRDPPTKCLPTQWGRLAML